MRLLLLAIVCLILAACAAGLQPEPTAVRLTPAVAPVALAPTATPPEPSPSPTPRPLLATISANVSPELSIRLRNGLAAIDNVQWVDSGGEGANLIAFERPGQSTGTNLAERVYAVVAPFATVRDGVSLAELTERWTGAAASGPLFVLQPDAAALTPVFGGSPAAIVTKAELLPRLASQPGALGLLPFDELDPAFKVLAVDGAQPLDKNFDAQTYPLTFALTISGPDAGRLQGDLAGVIPATNRDSAKLTTLVMTGVTAMSRMTAQRMERSGYDYPARVIGPTLRQADITHVSNEVPFIPGCKVNASANNLRFCSDTTYWAALEAIGVDIVGLSGNHVNDFGRKGARQSLAFYRQQGVGIYGSGLDEEQACEPLLWEHNGNTFAFIAALAYQPRSAWATETEPGACYYYTNKQKILDRVRQLSTQVDVVAVELQHYERYNPRPTPRQVQEFRELRQAGADIVTGVQSHVPQAIETYGVEAAGDAGVIAYGLGNLFFDQMWSWQTRTGLILRHTLYDGRLLNTEILTTVLENHAQPRWATQAERAQILRRIFDAAPALPSP